ncbi:MAG: prephenate dehydratase [Actinobacteria bacterium]|nr:prephenate dehydratase [Actinomycetota bacterium]
MSKVAYQGESGAYSERAVRVLFPDSEPLPCETIRLTFSRVTSGEADFGVVPVENSQAGSVNETYDLLLRSSLVQVVGEVTIRVDHALLGPPGARLEGITRAYSHWQALAQCEEFLSTHHIDPVPVHDTAGGARLVAEAGRTDEAAIASVEAGANLGLTVLAEHIQTYPDNFTKFGAIGTRDAGLGPSNRTSLVMAGDDRPGSLFRALQPFADRGVNLTKLESRPRRGAPFEYVFYIDLDGSAEDANVAAALDEVRQHTSMLKVLGSFPASKGPI